MEEYYFICGNVFSIHRPDLFLGFAVTAFFHKNWWQQNKGSTFWIRGSLLLTSTFDNHVPCIVTSWGTFEMKSAIKAGFRRGMKTLLLSVFQWKKAPNGRGWEQDELCYCLRETEGICSYAGIGWEKKDYGTNIWMGYYSHTIMTLGCTMIRPFDLLLSIAPIPPPNQPPNSISLILRVNCWTGFIRE